MKSFPWPGKIGGKQLRRTESSSIFVFLNNEQQTNSTNLVTLKSIFSKQRSHAWPHVLRVVTMKHTALCGVTWRSLVNHCRSLELTCYHNLQGGINHTAQNAAGCRGSKNSGPRFISSAGNRFLQNMGELATSASSHPRRQHSSETETFNTTYPQF
jgi:hypothetical protein